MGKQFAFRLALIAFVSLALKSLFTGVDFFSTTEQALIAMGLFFVFGYFLGDLARRLVEEHTTEEVITLIHELTATTPDSL